MLHVLLRVLGVMLLIVATFALCIVAVFLAVELFLKVVSA